MFDITIGQAGLYALLGYAIVFFGLILLMIVIILLGKAFTSKLSGKAAPAPAPAEIPQPEAPGSAGKLKLNGVEPKTAAMVMAIVADKLQKPINELRFLSIKEVDQ